MDREHIRTKIFGSTIEQTPEGLYYADQMRYHQDEYLRHLDPVSRRLIEETEDLLDTVFLFGNKVLDG